MGGWRSFYNMLKVVNRFLGRSIGFLPVLGWLFVLVLAITAGLVYLAEAIGVTQLRFAAQTILIGFIASSFLFVAMNNKRLQKSILQTSHKSYFFFVLISGMYFLSFLFLLSPIFNQALKDFPFFVLLHSIEIIFTVYGVASLFWFSYQLTFHDSLPKLKVQLSLYTYVLSFFQFFLLRDISSFSYCASVLLLTYTFVKYLFEKKAFESNLAKSDERDAGKSTNNNNFPSF